MNKQYQENQLHEPPFGLPDKTDHFKSQNYESVTYIYFCHEGKYIAITYTLDETPTHYYSSKNPLAYWKKSVYISNCIK